jgi:hypothetical protein
MPPFPVCPFEMLESNFEAASDQSMWATHYQNLWHDHFHEQAAHWMLHNSAADHQAGLEID